MYYIKYRAENAPKKYDGTIITKDSSKYQEINKKLEETRWNLENRIKTTKTGKKYGIIAFINN